MQCSSVPSIEPLSLLTPVITLEKPALVICNGTDRWIDDVFNEVCLFYDARSLSRTIGSELEVKTNVIALAFPHKTSDIDSYCAVHIDLKGRFSRFTRHR